MFFTRPPAETPAPEGMRWTPRAALAEEPVPKVMRKVFAHALPTPTPAGKAVKPPRP